MQWQLLNSGSVAPLLLPAVEVQQACKAGLGANIRT